MQPPPLKAPRRAPPRRAASGRETVAAIDLGTNNCRLLIAHPKDDGFEVVDSFSRPVRLGDGLETGGALSAAAMRRTFEALRVCADKLRRHGRPRLRAVATEACRRARNGRDFLERAYRITGIRFDLITPEEEARLAVAGCAPLLDSRAEHLLTLDIGGGSTELIWVDLHGTPPPLRGRLLRALAPGKGGLSDPDDRARAAGHHIMDWISAPSGVASLHDRFAHLPSPQARFDAMTAHFEAQIEGFAPRLRENGLREVQLIGASGTVTTLAGAQLGLTRYDRNRVDGMWLDAAATRDLMRELVALDDAARARHSCIGADRALMIVAGAAIVDAVLRLWPVARLRVADRGLREGILYAQLWDLAEERRRTRT